MMDKKRLGKAEPFPVQSQERTGYRNGVVEAVVVIVSFESALFRVEPDAARLFLLMSLY